MSNWYDRVCIYVSIAVIVLSLAALIEGMAR